MLEFNKRTHKVLMYALVVLVLLQVLIESTDAATKCHQCTGINCQRMTYAATEDCADELDSCITIFQDCMGSLKTSGILYKLISPFACRSYGPSTRLLWSIGRRAT